MPTSPNQPIPRPLLCTSINGSTSTMPPTGMLLVRHSQLMRPMPIAIEPSTAPTAAPVSRSPTAEPPSNEVTAADTTAAVSINRSRMFCDRSRVTAGCCYALAENSL